MAAAPRTPIERSKSGTLDFPDQYQRKLREFRDACLSQAMETLKANPEYKRLPEYMDLVEGRHWNTPDLRRVPVYRSRFVDNLVGACRLEKLAELTDIRPIIDVQTTVDEWKDQASVCEKVIRSEWYRKNFDHALLLAVDHATYSEGFWYITSAAPGTMDVVPCGMGTVLTVDSEYDIQQSSAMIYQNYFSAPRLINRWPEHRAALEKEVASPNFAGQPTSDSPWNNPQMQFSSLHMRIRQKNQMRPTAPKNPFSPILKTELWVDDYSLNETKQPILVRDPRTDITDHNYWYWVQPGERLFPRKRLVVFGGDTVLWDGPNPFWHGLYPFARLQLRPTVMRPGGMSVYRDMAPINRGINKIGAGTLEAIEKAINPAMLTRDGALGDEAWNRFFGDMPGTKLKVSSRSGNLSEAVHWQQPPVLPSYLMMMWQQLGQSMNRHGNTVDVNSLGRKNQVPGGDTIEQMKDSLQTRVRMEMRQIELILRDAGYQAISHVFQNYTLKRRMKMLGPDGMTSEDFLYDPGVMTPGRGRRDLHHRNFNLLIVPGSLHGSSKDREKQISIVLYKINAISRRELLRRLDWGTPIEQIESEIAQERAVGMQPDAVGKGRTPRLLPSERVESP